MKFLVRTLIGFAISALIVIGIAYFFQDANRFKPEIQAFIEERTGIRVDYHRRPELALLSPPRDSPPAGCSPITRKAATSLARWCSTLNLMSVIRSRDINQWEVVALTLDDLTIAQGEELTEIDSFVLRNFKPATVFSVHRRAHPEAGRR